MLFSIPRRGLAAICPRCVNWDEEQDFHRRRTARSLPVHSRKGPFPNPAAPATGADPSLAAPVVGAAGMKENLNVWNEWFQRHFVTCGRLTYWCRKALGQFHTEGCHASREREESKCSIFGLNLEIRITFIVAQMLLRIYGTN